MATIPILTSQIRFENDVVTARQRARRIAELTGFDVHEQTRVATAVSEMARNAFMYAGGGKVEFLFEMTAPQGLLVRIKDTGPGIPHLKAVLQGAYVSDRGMGLGIIGTKRLMDHFEIASEPGQGTEVALWKHVPKRALPVSAQDIRVATETLARQAPRGPLEEIQAQNHELLQALDTLRARETELNQLNRELEDTNRGVVALYAELDEKAVSLRQISESKTRFLSNMTHEFRTPLNSIMNISALLLERVDGELTTEQERQVAFIRQSAESLSTLVNDLLDLAKVEAGKVAVRAESFTVNDLFGALRGVFKSLTHIKPQIELSFENDASPPLLHTDEGKVAQILRNLISNALKYTPAGRVTVSARPRPGDLIEFCVADTGIGIAPADQERVFEDFTQIENELQSRVKGTGLGLPLSKRLTSLLGGSLTVRSEVGKGSLFKVTLPVRYTGPDEASYVMAESALPPPAPATTRIVAAASDMTPTVLVIDDESAARYHLSQLLLHANCQVLLAGSAAEGLALAFERRPQLIILDYYLPDLHGPQLIAEFKGDPRTAQVPLVLHTSKRMDLAETRELERSTLAILSKDSASAETLGRVLAQTGIGTKGIS